MKAKKSSVFKALKIACISIILQNLPLFKISMTSIVFQATK